MNGHDLREGMRVRVLMSGRCAFVLGKDKYSSRDGTVIKVGPQPLGAMPTWALVDLDGDDENPHRIDAWNLIATDNAGTAPKEEP